MTRRILTLLLALMMVTSVLTACASDDDEMHKEPAPKGGNNELAPPAPREGGDDVFVTVTKPPEGPLPTHAGPTVPTQDPRPTTTPTPTPKPTTTPTPTPVPYKVKRHHITYDDGVFCWCWKKHPVAPKSEHTEYDCVICKGYSYEWNSIYMHHTHSNNCWCKGHDLGVNEDVWEGKSHTGLDCWCMMEWDNPIPGSMPEPHIVLRHHICGSYKTCWCGITGHANSTQQHTKYDCWCVVEFGKEYILKHHISPEAEGSLAYDTLCWCGLKIYEHEFPDWWGGSHNTYHNRESYDCYCIRCWG